MPSVSPQFGLLGKYLAYHEQSDNYKGNFTGRVSIIINACWEPLSE